MNLDEAIEIMRQNGYKYTDRRKEILAILFNFNKYVSVKTILTEIQKKFPGLSTDTIYRNLATFTELGIIEATEFSGEKYFRFNFNINKHHHNFICFDCGKIKEITICPMNEVKKQLQNYKITGHKLEIYGKCSNCLRC